MAKIHELMNRVEGLTASEGHAALEQFSAEVRALTAEDFHLAERMAQLDRSVNWHCLDYHKGERCHAAVFLLPAGHRIPIHDHPEMTVLLKVLWGHMEIRAFDWATGDDMQGLARVVQEEMIDGASDTQVVRPSFANLHELKAHSDVAFLDIFSPYYCDQSGRPCHYYRAQEDLEMHGQRFVRLEQVQ